MVRNNVILEGKTILITGTAGFIGHNLSKRLLQSVKDCIIVGIDNMNDYYDVRLKEERLKELSASENFIFIKGSIADKSLIEKIFREYHPHVVVNLAAQAGVRYSITNPDAYIESNLIGFYNILEACRHYGAVPVFMVQTRKYHTLPMTRWTIPYHFMQLPRKAMN